MYEQYFVVNQGLDAQQNLLYDLIIFCEPPCVRKKWCNCYNGRFSYMCKYWKGKNVGKSSSQSSVYG